MLSAKKVPKPRHFGITVIIPHEKRAGYKFLLARLTQGSFLPSSIAAPSSHFKKECLQMHFKVASQFPKTRFASVLSKLASRILAIMFRMRSISRYRTTVR